MKALPVTDAIHAGKSKGFMRDSLQLSYRAILIFIILVLSRCGLFAQTPAHKDFGKDCATCHVATSWKEIKNNVQFDHAQTGFALVGLHQRAQCRDCHRGGKFSATNTKCNSCHQDVHKAELGNVCERCHTAYGWRQPGKVIAQHEQTRFPLVGVHVVADCGRCHPNQQKDEYVNMSVECFSCHQQDYQQAREPNHVTAKFETDCSRCHTIIAFSWKQSTFQHPEAPFRIDGAHSRLECASCHQGVFAGTSTECVGCHLTHYSNTMNPDHQQVHYPTTCTVCHSTSAWKPAQFNHSNTKFPLTGAHTRQECSACHGNNQYTALLMDCYSCHQKHYLQATNPNHQKALFNRDCAQCHSTDSWRPATFDHSTTKFPLTGAHTTKQCAECHKNGNYNLNYTDCYQCHQGDFTGVTNPNHASGNFAHDCTQCHTTNGWKPANYDHSKTQFPLTGAHTSQPCQACHKSGVFTGTLRDCYSCHQTDYSRAMNPNHATSGFSTDCASCHSTTAWKPSTFDHDAQYFPIYSGKHRGKWATCNDCHTDRNNFKIFSCITCHAHDKAKMDNKHRNKQGYVYESAACYRCHPRGKE